MRIVSNMCSGMGIVSDHSFRTNLALHLKSFTLLKPVICFTLQYVLLSFSSYIPFAQFLCPTLQGKCCLVTCHDQLYSALRWFPYGHGLACHDFKAGSPSCLLGIRLYSLCFNGRKQDDWSSLNYLGRYVRPGASAI
jgi:hypothetical protein